MRSEQELKDDLHELKIKDAGCFSNIKKGKYHAYEAAKRQWIAANPAATPEQYEKAMRLIAKRFGV